MHLILEKNYILYDKMLAISCRRSSSIMNSSKRFAIAASSINLDTSLKNNIQYKTILGISKVLEKRLYTMAKGVMPAISQTEQVALGCGTIGFDCDIFTGSPSLQHLVDTYDPKLSEEELSFLDNEVNELFNLLNDHDISTSTKKFRNI